MWPSVPGSFCSVGHSRGVSAVAVVSTSFFFMAESYFVERIHRSVCLTRPFVDGQVGCRKECCCEHLSAYLLECLFSEQNC